MKPGEIYSELHHVTDKRKPLDLLSGLRLVTDTTCEQ
jgi:hypothetical protein